MITHRQAKALLHYDPKTGIVTWKRRDVKWFTDGKRSAVWACAQWNGRFAGKVVGTTRSIYAQVYVLSEFYLLHRLIWFWMTGEWPSQWINHEDLDTRNNRWRNLVDESPSYNQKHAYSMGAR